MNENDQIINTVLDYVEGWYSGNSNRMDNALSEHLAKRRIGPDGELMEVSKEWMVTETGNGIGRITDPDSGRKEIKILAQTPAIASVELLSNDFVDYIHLVKIDGRWKIANALWDYHSNNS